MTDITEWKASPRDKIDILLAEYETLRYELVHRSGLQGQTLGAAAAALAAIVVYGMTSEDYCTTGYLVALVLVFGFLVIRYLHLDICMQADRVKQIESSVNQLAGETLMRWESKFGIDQIGYLRRFRDIFLGRSK